MKTAVITVTEKGRDTAFKLKERLSESRSVDIYCYERYAADGCIPFSNIYQAAAYAWERSPEIIFIAACGIAVRAIAPLIGNKTEDPCVVAADCFGGFAVSLLSGHLGGGNSLCRAAAEILGAVPVITTATDAGGRFSPDMLAKTNGLAITDMSCAKLIAAETAAGRKVGMVCRYPFYPESCGEIFDGGSRYGVCITGDLNDRPFPNTLVLTPKNIIAGAGCKKGTNAEIFEERILAALSENGILPERLCCLATVDIKKDEPAVKAFCSKYHIPLKTFSPKELMEAEGDFESSDFVMKTTGADNICQRSVRVCGGVNISRRYKGGGVACAVGELPVRINFSAEDCLD